MRTSDLTGAALDWAVAKCEEVGKPAGYFTDAVVRGNFNPATNWGDGGPIIEREGITIVCAEGDYSSELGGYETYWVADIGNQCADSVYGPQGDNWGTCFQIDDGCASGATPLIAAMRCYVTSKLGEFVDIPEELT